jgi:uncharacterized membrane protein
MTSPETISVSAIVEAPIWRVYQNWRRFERFPSFVPAVREARWDGRERLYWREEYEGKEYELTYEVKLKLAESSLSWRSLSGPESSGTAVVEPQPMGWSRITLTVSFVPDDGIQSPAAVQARHRGFLMSFKHFVEASARRRA